MSLPGRKPSRTVAVRQEIRPDVHHGDIRLLAKRLTDDTGCEVIPQINLRRQLERFDIFGSNSAQLDATVKSINRWIEMAQVKSSASSSWAKLPAYDFNRWYYDQIDTMEDDRKQEFKGPVPDDLPYSIIVDWPEDLLYDQDITPRSAFGPELRVLDSIRMEDEVWIRNVPTAQSPWQVEICGFDMVNIEKAKRHYLTETKKARASRSSHSVVNIVLDKEEGNEVLLVKAGSWWPSASHPNLEFVPRLVHLPVMEKPGSFRNKSLDFIDVAAVQRELSRALETIKYEKGYYDLTVRFGCVAVSGRGATVQEIGKKHNVKGLLNAIDGGVVVSGQVKKWAFNYENGGQVLSRLTSAENVLAPVRPSGTYGMPPASLEATLPTFRGTFALHDPNKPLAGFSAPAQTGRSSSQSTNSVRPPSSQPLNIVVVQVEWTEDEEGYFEKMPARFYRLKPGVGSPTVHLDVNLFELGIGKGWHFGIEKMYAVSKSTLSTVVTNFADSVRMKRGYSAAINSLDSFATWTMTPSVKIHFGKLEKVYKFGIQETDYTVEHVTGWYPKPDVPCCGLVVRHAEWESHLAELERLPVGHAADFGDTLRTFFPDNGCDSSSNSRSHDKYQKAYSLSDSDQAVAPGLKLLMRKLMQLSAIVNSDGRVAV